MLRGRRGGQAGLFAGSYGHAPGGVAIAVDGGVEYPHGSSTGARGTGTGGVNGMGRFGPWQPINRRVTARTAIERPRGMFADYPNGSPAVNGGASRIRPK